MSRSQAFRSYSFDKNYNDAPRELGDFRLYLVGRRFCRGGESFGEHSHRSYYEFTAFTAGEGTVTTNGATVPVRGGDVYLSLPGDFHGIASSAESPLRYDYISVAACDEGLSRLLEEATRPFRDADARILQSDTVTSLVCRAVSEETEEDGLAQRMLEAILTELFCVTAREMSKRGAQRRKSESEPELLCYRIMSYIDSHIYSLRNLAELSDALLYNYNYLSNLFKSVTGNTVASYFRERRLETARLLLSEGNGATKVASLLGYSSVYTFSRAFKDRYGIPPKEAKRGKATDRRVSVVRERIEAERELKRSADSISFCIQRSEGNREE